MMLVDDLAETCTRHKVTPHAGVRIEIESMRKFV